MKPPASRDGFRGYDDQAVGKSHLCGFAINGRSRMPNGLALRDADTYTGNMESTGCADVQGNVLTPGAEISPLTGTRVGPQVHCGTGTMTVDFDASDPVTEPPTPYLQVKNLLDRQFRRLPGYGARDRAAHVGIRAHI